MILWLSLTWALGFMLMAGHQGWAMVGQRNTAANIVMAVFWFVVIFHALGFWIGLALWQRSRGAKFDEWLDKLGTKP